MSVKVKGCGCKQNHTNFYFILLLPSVFLCFNELVQTSEQLQLTAQTDQAQPIHIRQCLLLGLMRHFAVKEDKVKMHHKNNNGQTAIRTTK